MPTVIKGLLQIADLGLARFHREDSRSNTDPRHVGFSPTYRPPECDTLSSNISQAFDIWSLGCVYLEFTSWYMLGFQGGIDQFAEDRIRDDGGSIPEDNFFILSAKPDGRPVPMLKPSIWAVSGYPSQKL